MPRTPRRLSRSLQRLGFAPRRKGKSVLVWGASPRDFARAERLLGALARRNPRLNLLRLCPRARALSRPEPGAPELLAPPVGVEAAMRLWLARSRARLLLLTAPPDAPAARLVGCAARQGVAIAALGEAPPAPAGGEADWRGRVALWIRSEETDAGPAAQALLALALGRKGPLASAAAPRRPRGIAALAGSPLLRWKYRSIASLEELRRELGRPEAILCLGNGPSSEDPHLSELACDALFRVNHAWLSRGFLTRPQMVFTGRRASIAAVRGKVVFGFQTREEERKLMGKCLWLPRKIRFATAERLGVMDFASFGAFVPTNGAVMLATAVALQPRRLAVAGIDLFQHPAGSYPGDADTPNAYTLLHDADTELGFLLAQLDRFRGELILVGEVLARHYRAHRERQGGAARH